MNHTVTIFLLMDLLFPVLSSLKSLNYNPFVFLYLCCRNKSVCKDICSRILTATSFVEERTGNSKSINRKMVTVWFIHVVEYYAAIKNNELN